MDPAMPHDGQLERLIFRRSLPLRVRMDEILCALGPTGGLTGLELALDNGVMSWHLRRRGGTWHTVVGNPSVLSAVKALVHDNVAFWDGKSLPFPPKTFDVVIAGQFGVGTEDPEGLIAECHRVLKADGRLILIAPNRKRFSVLPAIRKWLRRKPAGAASGMVRRYTESELFRILRNGFDVHAVRTFSRFFVEFVDAMVGWLASRLEGRENPSPRSLVRLYTLAFPHYVLAAQMDMLLFFTRGHYLLVTAKRRAWRPREAPVLTDGRLITEVVLRRAPR